MLTAAGTIGVRHGFAPDPALPGRDLLLDQDAAREHLDGLLGRPVGTASWSGSSTGSARACG